MVSRKSSRTRPLLFLLLVALLVSSFPVSSAAAIGVDDSGSGPGGTADPKSYTYGKVECRNGAGYELQLQPDGTYVSTGKLVWSSVYSQCSTKVCPTGQWSCTYLRTTQVPEVTMTCAKELIKITAGAPQTVPACRDVKVTTARAKSCQTHWEVWRFYGTTANPLAAWTVSRVYLGEWCQPEPPLTVYTPHPDDAGYAAPPSLNNPFVTAMGTNRYGETFYATHPSGKHPQGAFTSAPPFRSSGSCTSLVRTGSSNPYAESTEWADIRRYEMFLRFATAPELRVEVNAKSMANLKMDGTWEDGIPCSSGAEFVPTAAALAANPGIKPVFGTCWIPVNRELYQFTGPNGVAVWNVNAASIHRYAPSNPAGGRLTDHMAWRNGIFTEVSTRPGSNGVANPPGSQSWTPGEPANGTNNLSPNMNRSAAAAAARDYATCVDGPLSADDRTTGTDEIIEIPITGTAALPNMTIRDWAAGSCVVVSNAPDGGFNGCAEYAKLGSTYMNAATSAAQSLFSASGVSGPGVYDLGVVHTTQPIPLGLNKLIVRFQASVDVSGSRTPPGTSTPGPCPGACDGATPARPSGVTPSIIYTIIVPRNFNTGAAMRSSQKVTVVAHGLDTTRLCPASDTRSCTVNSLSMTTTLTGENGFTQFKKSPSTTSSNMGWCTDAVLRAAFSPNSSCKQEFTMDLYRATETGQGIRASVTGSGQIVKVTKFAPITFGYRECLAYLDRRTRTCTLPRNGLNMFPGSITIPLDERSDETGYFNLRVITRIIFADKAYGSSPNSYASMLTGLDCATRPRCAVRPVISSAAIGS